MKLVQADFMLLRGEPLLRDRPARPKGNPAPKPRGKGKSKNNKPTPDAEPCKLSAERLAQLGATPKKTLASVQLPEPHLQIGALL